MIFKTPLLCDRRVYDKKGKWKSPNDDIAQNVFYFIKENLTLVPSYVNGREELKETLTITVFGSKPFAKEDLITLDTGVTYRIQEITPNFIEHNVMVTDLLKPRIESCDLVLE
ncbi:MAG: hypothetical protein J6S85_17965 [Methanobrevibacter sp.]|nr:hypothetical protein [Methanobrevibacter sp.]